MRVHFLATVEGKGLSQLHLQFLADKAWVHKLQSLEFKLQGLE